MTNGRHYKRSERSQTDDIVKRSERSVRAKCPFAPFPVAVWEHLATGDHGTSAFHVPNLHDYSLNSTMQVPDLSAQQSPPSRPTSPPIYTQL